MSINSNYLFVVNMDVDADKEALFNEILSIFPIFSRYPVYAE